MPDSLYYKKPKTDTMPLAVRMIIITSSLVFTILFLYLALKDNSIDERELISINVILKETPEYDVYKIKNTTYRDIIIITKQYQKEFRITAMTYEAANHTLFKASVFAGDTVELKTKKSAVSDLNKNTSFNNYNEVYGIIKNGTNYVDLNKRTKLLDKDSNWAYFLVIWSLVLLPYGFIKNKPIIAIRTTMLIMAVIGLLILIIVRFCL